VAAVLLVASPLRAGAHARITAVFPAPSSTVTGPLRQVLLRFNEPVDRSFFRLTIDSNDGSAVAGTPHFQDDSTVIATLQPSAAGALVVTWLAVGLDAHPVQGQYFFAVSTPTSGATLQSDITRVSGRVGSFESGAGAAYLTGVIEAGRSVEVVMLYLVLGTVLIGVLVLRPRLAFAGAGGEPPTRALRTLLGAGAVSAALMPLLFWVSADRLTELIPGVGFSRILLSSIGAEWAAKTVLWLGLVGFVFTVLHRTGLGRPLHRRLLTALVALAVALAGAFVAGTHVGTGSAGAHGLYIPLMVAHILLTAFWAGGLLALLLVVFPGGDTEQVWAAVSRFSRIMTVTAGILVATGLLLLVRLLANFSALWCTGYGLVAGFKVATVALALVIGLANNRLVAAHRREAEQSAVARRMSRRRGPSIRTLRRVVVSEAGVLVVVIVLAAVLGETQLPPIFSGRALPGLASENILGVTPTLLGSGCR
jgi:putative copper export protein/methionine-rich copper-binding protein CopC